MCIKRFFPRQCCYHERKAQNRKVSYPSSLLILMETTYKICLGTQPPLLVLVEKSLEDVTSCHSLASLNLEWLVQNVVIHLRHISAVKRRLI